MSLDLSQEAPIAVAAVRAASRVCRSVQHRLVEGQTLEKSDKSPVTIADFASQAIALSLLQASSTVPRCVGEEDASALRGGEAAPLLAGVVEHARTELGESASETAVLDAIDLGNHEPHDPLGEVYWTLDPIDGTKGFLRGEQYAVALGLIDSGRVVLGVLGCPNLDIEGVAGPGCVVLATRDGGAVALPLSGESLEGRAVRVSSEAEASACRFVEWVESGDSDQSRSQAVAKALGMSVEPYRIDSQCKYAAVADGLAEVYLRLPTRKGYQEKIWDHAAGMIVVEEAGGTVTDVHGQPLDFTRGKTLAANAGIIATHGPLHDRVVAAVRDANAAASE